MENKKRVLYISNGGSWNGADQSLADYITGMQEQDVQAHILVSANNDYAAFMKRNGIKVVIMPFSSSVKHIGESISKEHINNIFVNLSTAIRLVRYVKQNHIDIIHSNTIGLRVGAIAAWICRIPHIWHIREFLKEDHDREWIFPRFTLLLMRDAAAFIAISESIKDYYHKKYGICSQVLYDALDQEKYRANSMVMKEEKNEALILMAGTIKLGKGQIDLVHAIDILKKRGVRCKAWIVGSIADKAYAKSVYSEVKRNGLQEDICFLPFTKKLQTIRERTDIAVIASKSEAFGRVTAEAMLGKKLVIGADTGATQELIGKGSERGYLYKQGDAVDLADRIEYALKHQNEWNEKKDAAFQWISEQTDVSRYCKRMCGIYNEHTGKKKK